MDTRRWFVTACTALALGAFGCRSTEILMVNDVGEDAIVSLQGPGKIEPNPPALAVANAGTAYFTVQTPPEDLPANYQWQAVGRTGTIIITKETPTRVVQNLSTGQLTSHGVVGRPSENPKPSVDVKLKP